MGALDLNELDASAEVPRSQVDSELNLMVTLDSGAAASVMPPGVCPGAQTTAPIGVIYRAANGTCLDNQGTRRLVTRDGVFRFGLADVTRPLLSAGELVDKGHTIVLTQAGGHIAVRDASGVVVKRLKLSRRRGVFVVSLAPRAADLQAASSFRGQATRL